MQNDNHSYLDPPQTADSENKLRAKIVESTEDRSLTIAALAQRAGRFADRDNRVRAIRVRRVTQNGHFLSRTNSRCDDLQKVRSHSAALDWLNKGLRWEIGRA